MLLPLLLLFLPLNSALKAGLRGIETYLSDDDKKMLIGELNRYRAERRSSNMHCLTEWSKKLEALARNNTALCSDRPYKYQKGAAVIYVEKETRYLKELLSELDYMEAQYDYLTDQCHETDDPLCENYKQLVWWEGGKIGCTLAACRAPEDHVATMLTCVFEKRKHDGQPFARGKECNFCGSTNCTEKLCCDKKIAPPPRPIPPCGLKPTNLIPLYRLVHVNRNDTVLTTSAERRNKLIRKKYIDKGTLGYIVKMFNEDPTQRVKTVNTTACRHLLKLTELQLKERNYYVYVAGQEYVTLYKQNNYEVTNEMGYVVAADGLCAANLTAYQFNRERMYHYYTVDPKEAAQIIDKRGSSSQLSFVSKPFALWEGANKFALA